MGAAAVRIDGHGAPHELDRLVGAITHESSRAQQPQCPGLGGVRLQRSLEKVRRLRPLRLVHVSDGAFQKGLGHGR